MVFNGGAVFWIFVVISVWVAILSGLFIRLWSHYNRLTVGITKRGLGEILEKVMLSQADTRRQISTIEKSVSLLALDGKKHIQRMSVVRFNPFQDTGGSQSFTMAILDGKDDGFVMTSLFARNGHRWYVKEIRNGKGKDFELSKEEENAIKKAHII